MARRDFLAVASASAVVPLAIPAIPATGKERGPVPGPAHQAGTDLVVRTSKGLVEGSLASERVRAFKGIPFAQAPIGGLRWRPPRPAQAWTGVRKAVKFGPAPIQDPEMAALVGVSPPFSEDCLYLNVWTPAGRRHERLPVMVWIHGGAFVCGATDQALYDGTHLAGKDVVVVSIGYRVGAPGFLAHPELTREGRGRSGNYGLLDQIAGLQWVQHNIAAFGGDPHQVTIFGESAGGISVSMLAASPKATGLFQRAISQSGGSFGPPRFTDKAGAALTPTPLRVAEAQGEQSLRAVGAADITAARALPATDLLKSDTQWWPTFDGVVLPGDQYELYQAGRFNDTPVLVGTNSDEGALFADPRITPEEFVAQIRAEFGDYSGKILAAYPHATQAEAFTSAKNIIRDGLFAWHTWAWARLQSTKGRGPAYVYYFDQRTPASPDGASHGADLAYVFGNFDVPHQPVPRPEDETLSAQMQDYWVNFARTGNPNGSGLPAWPRFTTRHQTVLQLATEPHPRPLPNQKELGVLDGYFAWRRQQAEPPTTTTTLP